MTVRQKIGRHRCAICRHDERWRIELLKASGCSLDAIAAKFSVTRDAVHWHWHHHVSNEAKASYLVGPAEMEAWAVKAAREGDSVIDYMRMCRSTLVAQLAAANEVGDGLLAARVAVALTKVLTEMARVTGELGTLATSINVTNIAVLAEHPAFLRTQAALLQALAPFPDARAAAVAALRHIDDDNAPTALPVPAKPDGVIEHVA